MEYRLAFEDYLPTMAARLGEHGLMQELEKGFHLLADPSSHTITLQSLKQNAPLLGIPQMSDCELRDIIHLGDASGRGELNLHQFCVTMIRTSPALMEQALAILCVVDTPSDDDKEDDDDGGDYREDEEDTSEGMEEVASI
ncbi:hypothetical protein GOP47_0010746 [Adiantum capillus-veneris]|uniref:EF-hand domain-containing protein n=1 Tax=Adiantum capillus-veneris TaxID=13818 RepID=A0A9D4ZJ33_ADICA|nr:hypothetical protein GOP47_0010746 [Adiantum capillus-veneris]